jgi:hypothetical protein
MFIYTISLAASKTLDGKISKGATIGGYLTAVSKFIKTASLRQEYPLKLPRTGKRHNKIDHKIHDFKHWENMPNAKTL